MQIEIFFFILWVFGCVAHPTLQNDVRKRSVSNEGFSIPVTRRRLSYMKSGPSIMAQTRAKYRKHITGLANDKIKVSPMPSTVEADPTKYDQEYLAPVVVGGQTLHLDLDTGSSDLWVYSTYLPALQQANHSVFNPNKSSTAHHIPESSWSISYGDGSTASGNVWTDCTWVGRTVVENQGVELAEFLSMDFNRDPSDGILGLGFDILNSAIPMQKTFISNAIEQGLPEPVLTADLHPGAPGSYDFGFINASKYSGELSYAPVDNTDGYWIVNMTGWAFGYGTNQTRSRNYVQTTVVDTGTSVNYFSLNVVRGYWATVPDAAYSRPADGYIFPCGTPLPDFTVVIGNFTSTIPSRLIEYSPVSSNSSMCFGGIQNQEGLEFNILGDVFLKTIFAVFNMSSTPTVGFAPKAVPIV